MTKIIFGDQEYTGKDLTDFEKNLIRQQVLGFLPAGNGFMSNLFNDNIDRILGAAEVAKFKFDAPITGMYAGDGEVGLQLIRPSHVLRTTDTTETTQNDWNFTFTTDTDYWIGFGTNNTTAINIDREALVVPLGVMFTQGSAPIVEELYIQHGGVTYPIQVIRHAWLADNPRQIRAARIRPALWAPKDTVLVQVQSVVAGDQELVLAGITFGLGRFLRVQTPTTVTT